jgi:hypothetical protein
MKKLTLIPYPEINILNNIPTLFHFNIIFPSMLLRLQVVSILDFSTEENWFKTKW